ncbi:MAG TPA: GerMN domain-containing protein [Vicinamibacterales bacterium]|nr:GerMN domain-containing protein [Vicinamibacterales bacterium]
MSKRAKVYLVALLAVMAFLTWGLLRVLMAPRSAAPPPTAAAAPAETAHITATLYYGSSDGRALVAVRRDVPLASGAVEQGRQILTVQLQDAPPPYIKVIPAGTTLRAFYMTDRGDAFVDLSSDVVSGHPGGSLTELLTVYALVNAVTANLPAVQRVQLLVDGKEVDTIAGHVDVRRPLASDTSLLRDTRTK